MDILKIRCNTPLHKQISKGFSYQQYQGDTDSIFLQQTQGRAAIEFALADHFMMDDPGYIQFISS